MEGVGRIFENFRDGILEDDDEVALAHGPREVGYPALSEPMVNIRVTLTEAERAGIIASATREALERRAKDLFYPRRTYAALLSLGTEDGLPPIELDRLKRWLPSGRRNQKREDGLAMLRTMREFLGADSAPKQVRYSFEYTETWDHARRYGGEFRLPAEAEVETVLPSELLDELRLEGDAFIRIRERAIMRVLAIEEARRHGLTVSSESFTHTVERFRRENGLLWPEDVQHWVAKNDLEEEEFVHLLEEEALYRWVETVSEAHIASQLPAVLRLSGDYPRIRARVHDKKGYLTSHGFDDPSLSDIGLTEEALFAWYFDGQLGATIPKDVGQYAASFGFVDLDSFRRALVREFCYTTG
jgi:hypothetical protein